MITYCYKNDRKIKQMIKTVVMLSFFYVVLLSSAAFAAEHIVRKQPAKNATIHWTPRIINGVDAQAGEFPYLVSLNYAGDGHACGASVLTQNWVLTAAHCCLTGNALVVYAGSIYLSQGGQYYDIAKYVIHGDYQPETYWRNDICLINTAQPIQLNNNVKPVTLPAQGMAVNSGDSLTIPGWGVICAQDGCPGPDRLQVLKNDQALSNDECRSQTGVDVYEGQICAKGNNGRGVCSGDSGGPLTRDGVQVGITSFVFLPCGGGSPDFYTRVPSYINFIQQVLGSEASELKFASV